MLSKKDIVVSALHQEILSGKYACGTKIPSRTQLMRRFHCSRTVIERAVEELTAAGLNDSLQHVDFMVGTSDLSITATTESGEVITVFENGNWVI